MPMAAKGLGKLTEEMGELGQVVGKKLAYFHTDEHPDGGAPLSQRLEEEMGDVMAAIAFVVVKFSLDLDKIRKRTDMKYALFQKWDAIPDNNKDGVDR